MMSLYCEIAHTKPIEEYKFLAIGLNSTELENIRAAELKVTAASAPASVASGTDVVVHTDANIGAVRSNSTLCDL
jgi:3-deoxy-D-manno-octulosonate 8-phosphate phosphatase KdsC-like HAD superfamily phosphatase